MGGFYGNIRNATSNSFKFDRVYSNRALMDKNCNSDGVFGGRYVLVEYDQGLTEGIATDNANVYYYFNNKYHLEEPVIQEIHEDAYIQESLDNFYRETTDITKQAGKSYYIKSTNGIYRSYDVDPWPTEDRVPIYERLINNSPGYYYVLDQGDYISISANELELDNLGVETGIYRKITVNKYALINQSGDADLDDYEIDEEHLIGNLIVEIITEELAIDVNDVGESSKKHYLQEDGYFREKNGNHLYYDAPYQFGTDNQVKLNTTISASFFVDGQEMPHNVDLSFEDNYTINYEIDKAVYGKGRGYDSTVWRKVYKQDGSAQYVNIAELNSVVPTFAVTADIPTDVPLQPHFDEDSTNVYYNLHIQTPWGFRIGEATSNQLISKQMEPSKHFAEHETLTFSDKSDVRVRTQETDYSNEGYIIYKPIEYDGAIYFNLDGFNEEYSIHDTTTENNISLDSTGVSGKKYNTHVAGNNESFESQEQWEDTKELRMILPSLGNTIASVWDKMYGDGSTSKDGRRLNTILWEDPNYPLPSVLQKLHLVTEVDSIPDAYYYSPEGYKYITDEKQEIDTLAGAINSVHDLMGMIITKDEPIPVTPGVDSDLYAIEGDDTVYLPNASTKFIYYSKEGEGDEENHKFYYAGNGYGYEALSQAENSYAFLGVNTGTPNYSGYVNIDTDPQHKKLKSYRGGQYRKLNTTTWLRDDNNIAVASASYYKLPKTLKYVGNLMDPTKGNRYYIEEEINVGTEEDPVMKEVYLSTTDFSDAEKTYYSIHGISGNTGVATTYLIKWIQETENSGYPAEPYISTVTYYVYDPDRDEYTTWNSENKPQQFSTIEDWWNSLVKEGLIYRDGVFHSGRYNVFDDGSNYRVMKTINKGQPLEQISFLNISSNAHITNLRELYAYLEAVEDANNDPNIEYDVNNLYVQGETKITEIDGNYVEEVQYTSYPIHSFLFDEGDLYKLDTLTEEDENGNHPHYFYKTTFGENDIVYGQNQMDFYKITPKEARYYEKNRYFIFESDNPNVKDHNVYTYFVTADEQRVANKSYYKLDQNGNYVSHDGPLDQQYDVYEKQLLNVRNGQVYNIDTLSQSITKFQLSTNNYTPNADYWMILDNTESNDYWDVLDPEDTFDPNTIYENDVDGKWEWTEEGDPLGAFIVGYGADDFNITVINDKELYYTDNVFYEHISDDFYNIADTAQGYVFDPINYELYKQRQLYIIDVGEFGNKFNLYQKWNLNLIQSEKDYDYYFNPNPPVEYGFDRSGTYIINDDEWENGVTYYEYSNGEYVVTQDTEKQNNKDYYILRPWRPVVLGKRVNTLVKRELPGFARDLNTIHGLLLRINEILQAGDTRTRDTRTVQGCINTMNDLFEIFGDLKPGQLYGTDIYGKLVPIELSSQYGDNETWITINPEQDLVEDKMVIYITHNETDEFNNYIVYTANPWPEQNKPDIYEYDPITKQYSLTEDQSKDNNKTYYIRENQEYIDNLEDDIEDNETQKVHDVFGFNDSTRLILDSPVIDNAGHVVGSKPSHVFIADLLLESATAGNIVSSPVIAQTDTVGEALNILADYINEGAENITLNEFYNYYTDIINDDTSTFPYIVTEDTEPIEGKNYYIKVGNNYVLYTVDPWPTENPPTIYEKLTNVDNNDNLNEAIAKLQWQLDHIVHAPLTDLTDYALPNSYDPFGPNAAIAETDSLGTGLNKLQAQISAPIISTEESGIVNNYAAIIRTNGLIPTTKPQENINPLEELHVSALRSGWIWIDTSTNYIYMKTRDGCKGIDDGRCDYTSQESGYDTFADKYDQNFWELLNAWQ